MSGVPLLVAFVPGTRLERERNLVSQLPIVRNGPPGTFVVFPDGLRVSLPTDQVVLADDADGRARVGFGGMRFAGCRDGRLQFTRERELHPEEELSPDRSQIMTLELPWVSSVVAYGRVIWP